MPPYQRKVVQAHPSIAPSHPQIRLQWVPPILVVAQINMVVEPYIFRNKVPKVVNQIVQCPWEQNPICENLSKFDEAMDGDKTSQIWMLWFKWHHMIHLK